MRWSASLSRLDDCYEIIGVSVLLFAAAAAASSPADEAQEVQGQGAKATAAHHQTFSCHMLCRPMGLRSRVTSGSLDQLLPSKGEWFSNPSTREQVRPPRHRLSASTACAGCEPRLIVPRRSWHLVCVGLELVVEESREGARLMERIKRRRGFHCPTGTLCIVAAGRWAWRGRAFPTPRHRQCLSFVSCSRSCR